MRNIQTLLLVSLFFVLVSCDREQNEVDPKETSFPVVYNFVNEGPTPIAGVNFTAFTYFPKTDRTNLYYKFFRNLPLGDTARIVVDTASSTKTFGYVGCTQQMKIDVRRLVSPNLMYVSVWTTPKQIISSRQEAKIYFNWPADTLKASKVEAESYYVKL